MAQASGVHSKPVARGWWLSLSRRSPSLADSAFFPASHYATATHRRSTSLSIDQPDWARAGDCCPARPAFVPRRRCPPADADGRGGRGKTRLAISVGASLTDAFPDGVGWVDLLLISAGSAVAQAVANAQGIPLSPQSEPGDALVRHLADSRLLLILDNCEHVIDGCAVLAQRLLGACPQVQILATSRESLKIPGETVWLTPHDCRAASRRVGFHYNDSARSARSLGPACPGPVRARQREDRVVCPCVSRKNADRSHLYSRRAGCAAGAFCPDRNRHRSCAGDDGFRRGRGPLLEMHSALVGHALAQRAVPASESARPRPGQPPVDEGEVGFGVDGPGEEERSIPAVTIPATVSPSGKCCAIAFAVRFGCWRGRAWRL